METKVTTLNGLLINYSDAIQLQPEGHYLHATLDTNLYATDEVTGLHWQPSQICRAYCDNAAYRWTLRNDTVMINGSRFHLSYLSDNNIIETWEGDYMDRDEAYIWQSDGEYHSGPEHTNSLWDYAQGPREKDYRNGAKFGFGVEIEKNAMPSFQFNRERVYDLTGAVLERDGSVSQGFELKTPIYDLLHPDTESKLEQFKPYCDITNNNNAGGHIGFSVRGKDDESVLNGVRGFLPLIYAMYPNRVNNSYCYAKSVNRLKRDREKMQSVNLRGNYIEFRIFPAVYTYNTLRFRFRLMQLIAKNYGSSFFVVLTQLVTPGTELNELFRSTYYSNNDKFAKLVKRAVDMDRHFGTNRLTSSKIAEIDAKVTKEYGTPIPVGNRADDDSPVVPVYADGQE